MSINLFLTFSYYKLIVGLAGTNNNQKVVYRVLPDEENFIDGSNTDIIRISYKPSNPDTFTNFLKSVNPFVADSQQDQEPGLKQQINKVQRSINKVKTETLGQLNNFNSNRPMYGNFNCGGASNHLAFA